MKSILADPNSELNFKLLVCYNGKYGIINETGNWIVDPKYEELKALNGKLVSMVQGRWGVLGLDGSWIIQPLYESLIYCDERFIATKNGKVGVLNADGTWFIRPDYDDIISNGAGFVVQINNKKGILDNYGEWVVLPTYDEIDLDGEMFIFKQLVVGGGIGNFPGIDDNYYYGVMDRFGQIVIPPLYDSVSSIPSGYATTHFDSGYSKVINSILDKKGNEIINIPDSCLFDEETQGQFVVRNYYYDSDGNWSFIYGVIDRKGNWIIPCRFARIEFSKGLYICLDYSFNAPVYSVLDFSGNILSHHFCADFDFCGENFSASDPRIGHGTIGLVDIMGKWIIKPKYDQLIEVECDSGTSESNRYIAVINNGYGMIDEQENWIIEPIYSDLSLRFLRYGFLYATINELVGLIDFSGKWVVEPDFDRIEILSWE